VIQERVHVRQRRVHRHLRVRKTNFGMAVNVVIFNPRFVYNLTLTGHLTAPIRLSAAQ
jgi:hypothetical protein